jgi:hypothetical protein
MTTSEPSAPDTITLIVADDVVAAGRSPAWRREESRDDFDEHALPFIGKRSVNKEVKLDKLRAALAKAQDEVAALLSGAPHPNVPGFRLATVDIELAISAQGSIGIATAGAEASITLSFEREAKSVPSVPGSQQGSA